ncbi:MAG: sterol desaturase family protein [Hyphomicrobiaceae bacterium]|nr:sterol desaturase family protein [Hyphomicrobiaceae bacterium]
MDILDQFYFLFADFVEPKKRIFVGYLLLSIVIAFSWLMFIKRFTISNALARIFDGKIFFSRSAIADYKIFAINRVISSIISPLLVTQLTIATGIYFALHNQDFIPSGYYSDVSKTAVVAMFSVALFIVDDFTKYLIHRWMHRMPLLWAIHKIHHSAETLTPVTVYRVHPLEGVLYATRSAVAQAVALSVFFFLFGNSVSLATVVGVNVLVFVFHVTGSNLRHSHIDISYWPWLEHIFISPSQHQLHHSVAEEHFDKNFGAALAVWDWLFGSLHLSEKDQDRNLVFGLDASERTSATDLRTMYLTPFVEIADIVRNRFRRVRANVAAALTAHRRKGSQFRAKARTVFGKL